MKYFKKKTDQRLSNRDSLLRNSEEKEEYTKKVKNDSDERNEHRTSNQSSERDNVDLKHHSHHSSGTRKKSHSRRHSNNFIKSNVNIIIVLFFCFLIFGYVIYRIYSNEKEILGAKILVSLAYLLAIEAIIFALFLKPKFRQVQKTIFAILIIGLYILSFLAFSFYNILQPNSFYIILILINTFSILTSHVFRDRLFAYLGLTGIPVVPFLISADAHLFNQYFTFLVFVIAMIYVLSLIKKWKYVIYISSAVSWIISFIWMINFYLNDINFIKILPYICILFFMFHISYMLFRFSQHKKSEFTDNLSMILNFLIFNGIAYFILYLDTDKNIIRIFTLSSLGFHSLLSIIIYLQKRRHMNLMRLSKVFTFVFFVITIITVLPMQICAPSIALPAFILFFYGKTKQINFYMTLSYFLMFISFFCILFYLFAYVF